MDMAPEAGAPFDTYPRRKNKALILDITIVDPCVRYNLENAACHARKHLVDAVEGKKYNYRGSFPATYYPLSLAMSMSAGREWHLGVPDSSVR